MTTILFKRITFVLLIIVPASSFVSCTLARQSTAVLRSTDHFITHENDLRVLFEPGAEDYANRVVLFLPSAIQQVEERQYRSFAEPVRVYICASRKSFARMCGADVRAGVLTKLFLSPRIFEFGDDIARLYLIHELSHLHIRDQIGNYKMSRLPSWFTEGLATYVSDGGGAHTVTEKQAIESIKSGKYFVPDQTGGLIFRKTARDWGLEHHMFYRQSMLFISYMATIDESAFRNLLLGVDNGEQFSSSLEAAYNKKLEELWDEFLREVNNKGQQRQSGPAIPLRSVAGLSCETSTHRMKFETELYVWYGTNEYNFVKLENPPAYEPTKCADCGVVIRLGEDGYSVSPGRKYFCERCTNINLGAKKGRTKD